MDRTYKTEAIVLKRKNFGETDKFLTLYTKQNGKIRVIAKGIRRTTSRKAGSLELFNYCRLILAKGRNLDIITEVAVVDSFRSWRKNLIKVAVAFYFSELIDKLTPDGQENSKVFDLLREYLAKIGSFGLAGLVRAFEEQLLEELGFGIPPEVKITSGSLRSYIETITEKEINSPKILKNL